MAARVHHHTVEYSLGDLVYGVQAGHIGVPDFQRDFVWDPSQVVDLIDSVANGWPIGAILVLRGPQPFDLKVIDGGPEIRGDEIELYLLDGQQRVTALFHALADAGDTVYFARIADLDEDGRQRIRWERRDRFLRRQDLSTIFRLSELADERAFLARLESFSSAERPQVLKLREETVGVIPGGSYRVPAIVLDNEIELEALTRIFETLNRTGVKLDAFDLMVAVMRRADFLLRQRWEEAVEQMPLLKKMRVEGIEILKLIALWQRDKETESNRAPSRRVRGVRQRDVLNVPAEMVANNWDRAIAAYVHALEFVRDEAGVHEAESVPSWAMLLPIAYFLDSDISPRLVLEWYWRSVALQTYAQGANTQVTADVDDVKKGNAISPHAARASLVAALDDSLTRNRILKLALRGIARLTHQQDILSGEELTDAITEVSVPQALRGSLTAPRADLLIHLGLATTQSLAKARSEARRTQHVNLSQAGMRSQGFDDDGLGGARRRQMVLSWFEEWM